MITNMLSNCKKIFRVTTFLRTFDLKLFNTNCKLKLFQLISKQLNANKSQKEALHCFYVCVFLRNVFVRISDHNTSLLLNQKIPLYSNH